MSKEPTIQAYLNGKVTYDKDGQYFWITANNDMKMLAELRGWGKSGIIDEHLAAKLQDEIGEFIAEAINEKIEKLKNKPL